MSDKDIRYSITAEDRFSRTFASLKRDIAGAKDSVGGLVDVASRANAALGAITLGAAGAGGLLLGIKQLANELDALNDAADATGSTVENLSALERVARLNGESLEIVTTSAMRLNKVLNEAKPDSPIAAQLRQIGLDAAQLRQLDPSLAVRQVAVALAGFQDDGDKARLILDLFGKSAQQLAPYLKDLAEAGELNATVTAEQAQQAEKFNKELARASTNVSDAARAIVSDLLPAVNKYAQIIRILASGPSLSSIFGAVLSGNTFSNAADGLAYYNAEIAKLDEQLRAIDAGRAPARSIYGRDYVKDINERRAALLQFADTYRSLVNMDSAGAGRGFVNPVPERPSVGAPPAAPKKPAAGPSEAERYLEQLDRQTEKLRELTTLQQLEADIANRRIDGLTPKMEAELRRAAQRVDLQRQLNAEIEREAGFQRLLNDKTQRDLDEVQRLLSQTDSGRLQSLESQADKLLEFSRRIGEDDPRQKQVMEAMRRLREEAQKIIEPVQPAVDAYGRLADAVEKSMERTTSALLDMAISGRGSVKELGQAFAYDVLRELIEEPVRQVMKNVAKEIANVLRGQGSPIMDLFRFLTGGGGGAGGGVDWIGAIRGFFGGGTGRANGGEVQAGGLVRWQENGREWFVPGANGTVLTQGQLRAMSGPVQQTNHIVINGAVDPVEVQRRVDAAIARNNAKLARTMRFGGAMAG